MGTPRNNFAEQLARYNANQSTSFVPHQASLEKKSDQGFTFKKLTFHTPNPSQPPPLSLTPCPPLAPPTSHPPPTALTPYSPLTVLTPLPPRAAPTPRCEFQRTNPPVAFVAPVRAGPPSSCKENVAPKPPACPPGRLGFSVPGSSLAGSQAATRPDKADLQLQLERVLRDREAVMEEVCELLDSTPATTVTALLGSSAGQLQKRLAVRRNLSCRVQELRKLLETSQPSPQPLATPTTPDWDMDDDVMDEEEMADFFDDPQFSPAPSTPSCSAVSNQCHSFTSHAPTPTPPLPLPPSSHPPTPSMQTSFHPPLHPASQQPNSSHPPTFRPAVDTPDNSAEFGGPYPHLPDMMKAFTQVFGLKRFRPNQLEAINAVILGRDCFILMPTGGGKSLCYQLPALLTPAVTIVVSPLRSLIQDQVQKLCSLEIPACHLSSDVSAEEAERVYASLQLRDPTTRLLYVTPEKLEASNRLQSVLQGLHARRRLARVVVDEAHCISSWGHDFRPDYKRLGKLRERFHGVQLIALTATATPRVRTDILHQLHMDSTKWFTQSFNRTNLQYSVVQKKPKKVSEDIIQMVQSSFRNQSGIVYCLSRRDCEVMADKLSQAGVSALCYHAGLGDADRTMVQRRWIQDNCKVVCATIAFGMGIDKPDVRFVIHHSLPKSIEGYYQESGRAGRDGQPASCVLFYSYADMARLRRMIRSEKLHPAQERVHMDNIYRMVQYCDNEADCRRAQLLEYFAETFDPRLCKEGSTPCDNCRSQHPYRSMDLTALVRLIVAGVQQLSREQYTLVQLLEAVRGSTAARITDSQLGSLPLYGRGKDLVRHDAERLLHMLVLKDVLRENLQIGSHDNVICYIKPGPKAADVLSGRISNIVLKVRGKAGGVTGAAGKSASNEDPRQKACYAALLRERMGVAKELQVKNPEHVFSAATLRAMSQLLPCSREAMLGLEGVTESKWRNFHGERFLVVTRGHAAAGQTAEEDTRSQYWEGGASSEGPAPPTPAWKGKKRKSGGGGGPKRKRPAAAHASSSPRAQALSGDEFEQPALLRKPGFLPRPVPQRCHSDQDRLS